MKDSMDIPQKMNTRTTILSSYPTFGYLSKEYENTNLKKHMYPNAHSINIYNNQDMEAT